MKKVYIICFLASFFIVFSSLVPVQAAGEDLHSYEFIEIYDSASLGNEAELQDATLIWRYRTYNGKRQKRLWSIANSQWLMDWIDID